MGAWSLSSRSGHLKDFARSLLVIRPEYNLFSREYWLGQVDTRPLSVFRVALALLLLKDAIYDLPLARIFFSDEGIVPRSALWDGLARANRFSLMDALPYPWMATAFFLAWIFVLVLLLVGYRTRLMAILNAVMIVSIHERNLYVLNGADTVFRVLSLWSIFLPLGQYYSLDALRERFGRYRTSRHLGDLRAPDAPRTGYAFPLRIAQLQIALVYLFTGLLKLPGGPSAWARGEALYYALQLKSLTLPTGDWLLATAPDIGLRWIDYQTLFTELAFLLLVFSPFFQPLLRLLALALGVMLHGGIAATMSISNFSMVMIASYLLFCEPRWVAWIGARLRSAGRQALTIGVPPPGSPLWPLLAVTCEHEVGIDRSGHPADQSFDGWAAQTAGGQTCSGSAAWKQAAGHLPLSRLGTWMLRWKPLRCLIWATLSITARRVILPAPDDVAEPYARLTPPSRLRRWGGLAATGLVTLALAALMAAVIRWNLASATFVGIKLGGPVTPIEADTILYSGLWQNWAMFAPYPTTYDGWIIIPGTFEDSKEIDLRTGQPVSDVEYRVFAGPDARWKKYESNLMDYRYEPLFKAWGDYYCTQYNIDRQLPAGHRLATLRIVFRGRLSHVIGEPVRPMQDWLLWKHWCYPQYKF